MRARSSVMSSMGGDLLRITGRCHLGRCNVLEGRCDLCVRSAIASAPGITAAQAPRVVSEAIKPLFSSHALVVNFTFDGHQRPFGVQKIAACSPRMNSSSISRAAALS
jgi:hypothetical protein